MAVSYTHLANPNIEVALTHNIMTIIIASFFTVDSSAPLVMLLPVQNRQQHRHSQSDTKLVRTPPTGIDVIWRRSFAWHSNLKSIISVDDSSPSQIGNFFSVYPHPNCYFIIGSTCRCGYLEIVSISIQVHICPTIYVCSEIPFGLHIVNRCDCNKRRTRRLLL